jgi:integrase
MSTRVLPSGRVAARSRFKDTDGVVRPVEAQGADETSARAALTAKLNARTGPPVMRKKPKVGPDGELLSPHFETSVSRMRASTTMRDAVNLWLDEVNQDPHRKIQTRDFWRQVARQTILKTSPVRALNVSELTIEEFDAGTIRRYLVALDSKTPGQARKARLLIKSVMQDAVVDKAISHNPVQELRPLRKKPRLPTRALSIGEFRLLMNSVTSWREETVAKGGAPRDPSYLLVDLLWVLAGTGLRVNEALGLRVADLDLDAPIPQLTLRGTLVQVTGKPITWQSSTKTKSGDDRTMAIPEVVVTALRRQIALNGPAEYVFTTGTGGFVSNRNITRSLRRARPTTLEFFTPHTLRRSVATWLKQKKGLTAATAQLGHGTEDVTSEFYVEVEERTNVDNASALNELLSE